ncbi:MAG: serine/threonine protein kinase [Sedimentisphaerales bacterium]|nr:serine/threonine protein kinase [Sedimentisphaerales bacterium]
MSDAEQTKGSPDNQSANASTAGYGNGDAGPGGQIGPYKLLSLLGEGGCGIVYLAEQQQPVKRRVALKVIKPGMDTKQVIARFAAERQALALLDHPHIAHVFDAGTTKTGRPYFVMECVKGVPITEHCDRQKLSVEERLRLLLSVCEAVQHAHQKGIIHRDIKPSNILVAIEGDHAIPMIIDFGVAKALSQSLTDRTLVTEHAQMIGTPEYMSPEQAEMTSQNIDTRSDIYSLGVVLYELLTGVLPFEPQSLRAGGPDHIRRTIREEDPKTPSTRLSTISAAESAKLAQLRRTDARTLSRRLHGDLDWITLKAMEKDRTRRYASAGEFAADIRRHLGNEPVLASPPSTIYRFRKFVRRNRILVGGIAAVLMVLVLGVLVSTIFAIRAERARAEAQLVTNFLNDNVLGSASTIKGREATVIDVLNAAVAKLDEGKFRDRPLTEASIRFKLAYTYYDLGQYAVAAHHQKPVHSLYLEQLGENHAETNIALNWLAVFYYHAGRYREAEPLYKQVIEKVSQDKSGNLAKKELVWNANLGVTYAGLGRYEEAEQLVRPKVEATPGAGYGLHLGEIYREQGKYGEAERVLLESLNAGHEMDEWKQEVQFCNALGRCMHELALLRLAQGRDEDAEELFKQGIDFGTVNLPGEDHPVTLRHVNGLATIRIMQKQYREAEALLERALAGQTLKLGPDHPDTLKTIHDFGILRQEQGELDEAQKRLMEALEARQVKLGRDHRHTLETVHQLGVLHLRQARYEDAERLLLEAFHGRETKLGPNHPHTIDSLKQLVTLCESWPKPDEAAKWRAKLSQQGAD